MEEIMEFLLNLLFFNNGKFLITPAAKSVHATLKRCMEFKGQITDEYQKTTNILKPYDNMLEFINNTSLEYAEDDDCDNNNLVISGEISCKLYEEPNNIQHEVGSINQSVSKINPSEFKLLVKDLPLRISKSERQHNYSKKPGNVGQFGSKSSPEFPFINNYKHTHRNHDINLVGSYLEENLTSILRAQELLFKNIGKLVIFLEKQQHFSDLSRIKQKLIACGEILSDSPVAIERNCANDLVDEEIAKCRIGQGSGDLGAKNTTNDKASSQTQTRTPKKAKSLDVEAQANSSLILQANLELLEKTEENLADEAITTKYLSIKDDYLNRCRCSYHNRKHFNKFEMKLRTNIERKKEEMDLSKLLQENDSNSLYEQHKKEDAQIIAVNTDSFKKLEDMLVENEEKRKIQDKNDIKLREREIMIKNSREIILPQQNSNRTISLIDCREASGDMERMKSREHDVKLIEVNEKAFNDLEVTLKTSKILAVNKLKSGGIKTTTMNTKKRRIDHSIKKSMSTKQISSTLHNFKEISPIYKGFDDGNERFIKTRGAILLKPKKESVSLTKQKSKTFSKPKTFQPLPPPRISLGLDRKSAVIENFTTPMKVCDENNKKKGSNGHLKARTTKTAMKKMQALTILPKMNPSNRVIQNRMKSPQIQPESYHDFADENPGTSKIVIEVKRNHKNVTVFKWEEADGDTLRKVLCNQV